MKWVKVACVAMVAITGTYLIFREAIRDGERRGAREGADKWCMVFCHDVEAVSVGDGGVCACPVRSTE